MIYTNDLSGWIAPSKNLRQSSHHSIAFCISSIMHSQLVAPLLSLPAAKLVSSTNIEPIVLELAFVIAIVIFTPQSLDIKISTAGVLVTAHNIGPAPLPYNII